MQNKKHYLQLSILEVFSNLMWKEIKGEESADDFELRPVFLILSWLYNATLWWNTHKEVFSQLETYFDEYKSSN